MENKCFLCNATITKYTDYPRHICVECPRCGFYSMLLHTPNMASGGFLNEEDKLLFSGYLKNNSTRENRILIDEDMLSRIPDIAKLCKLIAIDEKIKLIIKCIAKNTTRIDESINLEGDFHQFYLTKEEEFVAVLGWMKEADLIKKTSGANFNVILTINGWRKYEEFKKTSVSSKKVFIAMSFDKTLDDAFFKAIKPACEECGFHDVTRVDLIEHNEQICDRIIAEIKESRFVIADFTQQKQGVYFEAGYAHGLGLEVIKTCREDDKDNRHFDTEQYNHIFWKELDELKEKLIYRIKATIK